MENSQDRIFIPYNDNTARIYEGYMKVARQIYERVKAEQINEQQALNQIQKQ